MWFAQIQTDPLANPRRYLVGIPATRTVCLPDVRTSRVRIPVIGQVGLSC